ncbi:SMP-30/gluconolactonase/LRE family protein [Microbacterium sp. LMC-P-041]|uniref:SMP-30/gluconolactonase/LRE family protein n=1 Tax=Microbacterium sp. LMC-P-041 TaxID=3040293 RepID=UPI00255535B4|nr:SMP-30/gluconolactonase/LRE family protein [Microbacterium sp. LMC-P-041]
MYAIAPETGVVEQIGQVDGVVLGLAVDAEGTVYLCDVINRLVVRVRRGEPNVVYSRSAGGSEYTIPNYVAFDDDGWLWLTDSGEEDPDNPGGRIVRIPPGGGDAEVMSPENLPFPNGLCIGPKGQIYYVDSFGHGVSELIDGKVRPVARLEGVTPDGIAAEADGGLLVSCYYPFKILRADSASGDVTTLLDDTVGTTLRMPTNISHFGPGLTSLAITNFAGHKLLAVDPGVAGMPLRYPTVRRPEQ